MRLELSSGPLNEAIAKLERIAALYERVGAAQGSVAAGGGGTVARGGGGRVVSGRSTVGSRAAAGGGVVEGLMRGNPGLSREAATVMAGNLPAGVAPEAGPTGESAWERTQRSIRTASAVQAARAGTREDAEGVRVGRMVQRSQELGNSLMARAQRIREARAAQEQKRIENFERVSQQTSGRGGGVSGFSLRERLRLGGTGLIAGVGGPWALGAAAVYGFVSAVRGAVQAVDELRRASLITGGSMQEVARLETLGVRATEANALRERLGSDPWAIMTLGYMPDPRLGGPQDNAAIQQRAIDRLRQLRGNPNAQLLAARRMGAGEDVLAAANLGNASYQYAQQVAAGAPTRKEAQDLADTQSDIAAFGRNLQYGAIRAWSRFGDWADRTQDRIRGGLGLPLFPHGDAAGQNGPGSPRDKADDLTRAINDLAATIKTTNRELVGRGMQDRGAFPSALWGTELMRGIRSGAIRMGAFK